MSEVTLNPLECALDEAQTFRRQVDALQAENDRLRGLVSELLVTLLRSGFDIEASWDRLRKLLCSDRACKVEVENAKLRNAVDYLYGFAKTCGVDADDLRELGVEVEQ